MRSIYIVLFGILVSKNMVAQDSNSESFLGKSAPVFSVTTIDGSKYQIGEPGDNIYVINFWFIACGPCRSELPLLNELANAYKNDSTIRFIAISNIDKKLALEYVQRKAGMVYELVEQAQYAADAFNVFYYPVNIIINRKGTVIFYEKGYQKDIATKLKQVLDSEF
ncbi:MAG: TlpA disulfide reductase family protein [Cyclobacteriaceae bacterium]